MITREEDIDADARCTARDGRSRRFARHLGRDRKTIRAYLCGDRQPGFGARAAVDPFQPFVRTSCP